MRQRVKWIGLTLILLLALGLWFAPEFIASQEQTPPRPRLAVLLVFDQMRGDYLQKWQPLFGEGGFKRLQSQGAWFTNCHYPYAFTLTGPGHASMVTGCSPDKHGIIANEWFDRVHREEAPAVGPPPAEKHRGPGPYRLKQETLGDVLLRVLRGKGRVGALSIKDRSAILLAALRAQFCYWFDSNTGQFKTSRYYRDEPHAWVTAFNKAKPADRWLGTSWDRLRPELDYERHSGPDEVAAEGIGFAQGQTFPHPFKGEKPNLVYYEAVTNSPHGNTLLLELAKVAITQEKLGQAGATDLLCLSFSSNDLIGHCWGPDSQEVLDVTLHSDVIVKDLLEFLDAKVGKENYIVAVCADHGVCPLPEVARAQGKKAGRVPLELLTSDAEAVLNKAYLSAGRRAPWLDLPKKSYNPWLYLNQATLREHGIRAAAAEQVLAEWLTQQPGVAAVYTRTQMLASTRLNPLGEQVRRSFDAEASGDVIVILEPYYLFSPPITSLSPKTAAYRTTHGTPYAYDTHVPLLVYGPGVRPGTYAERVTPQAVASILAEALALPRPAGAEAPVPAGLFRK
jgi:predicted AlkP superfamily pyrophosphatase or phosphodiesterase